LDFNDQDRKKKPSKSIWEEEVRAQLNKELAKFSWLTPIAIEILGGKFDPEKLSIRKSCVFLTT